MARYYVLTAAPLRTAQAVFEDHQLVAPNRRARLPEATQPPESLARRAVPLLPNGEKMAPEPTRLRCLTEAVRQTLGPQQAARTARVIAGGLARLLRAGADLERLAQAGSDRVRQLARVALRYRQLLRDRGMVDPAELLHRAAGQQPPREKLLLFGYARLDTDEIALLDALAGDGSVVVLPVGEAAMFNDNHATARRLAALGWSELTATPVGAPRLGERLAASFAASQPFADPTGVVVQSCADPEAEVRAALQQIKRLLVEGTLAAEIALVARDEDRYTPLVQKIAAEYQVPVRPQTVGPLAETRLGLLVSRLLAILADDAPFETTLTTLTDPLAGRVHPRELRAARARRLRGLAAWRELLPDHGLLRLLAERADLPAPGTAPADDDGAAALADRRWPLDDWRGWLRQVLREAGLPGRLASWTRELMAFKQLREGLLQLEAGDDGLTATEFAREVDDLLGALTVPLAPGHGGVPLHTPLALYGQSLDHLFVLGAAAGSLPPAISEDPFLDSHERARLADLDVDLESAVEQSRREQLGFWMMLQAARRTVTFLRPRVLGRGVAEPSAYLLPLDLPEVTPPRLLASDAEDRVYRLAQPDEPARHAWSVECRRELAPEYDEYDGILGDPVAAPERFSVSALLTLGQCPFRYLAQYGWRLRPVDEADTDPSPMLLGSLYHGVLELVVQAAIDEGRTRDQAWLADLIEPAVAVWLGEPCETPDAVRQRLEAVKAARPSNRHEADDESRQAEYLTWSHWPIIRRQVVHVLEQAVRCTDFLPPEATPTQVEFELQGDYQGVPVRGRVDRADEIPEGLRLLDYKSSGGKEPPPGIQGDDGNLTVDLQLPIYAALYESLYQVAPEVRYFNLRGRALVRKRRSDGSSEAVEAFVADVPRRLADGELPVAPDVKRDACRYCDFAPVCRVSTRVDRKAVR